VSVLCSTRNRRSVQALTASGVAPNRSITGQIHGGDVLNSLQDNDEYHKTWCQWMVFVCCLYKLRKDEDARCLNVVFTKGQKGCLEQAIAYCSEEDNCPSGRRLVVNFARWFWGPPDLDDFSHIAGNPLSDVTSLFVLVCCLRPQGTFLEPGSASRRLVQVRYMIRSGLLMWVRYMHERTKEPQRM
jgi:hypothetical protein